MKRAAVLLLVLMLLTAACASVREPLARVQQSLADSAPGGAAPAAAQETCTATVINAAGLYLRADHSLTARVIRLMPVAETVTVQGFYIVQDARQEWASVTTASGQTGWAAAWYASRRYLMWDESGAACLQPAVFLQYAQNPPPTAPPSWTPSASPSVTPVAPTATPTPGATLAIEPTPERTLLPSLTPGVPKTCEVKAALALRVRTGAGTTFPSVSPLVLVNEALVIDQVVLRAPYLWAHHSRGWTAIRSGDLWWVYGEEGQSEICQDVPGWPAGLLPPVPVV